MTHVLRLILACFLMLAAGQVAAYTINLNGNHHIGDNNGSTWNPANAEGSSLSLNFTLKKPSTLQQITFFNLSDVESGGFWFGSVDGESCLFCSVVPADVAIDGVAVGTLDTNGKVTLNATLPLVAGSHTLTISAGQVYQFFFFPNGYDDITWDKIQLDLKKGAILPSGPFDAVETGAQPGTPIYTKIAGSGFTLDILALKPNGGINRKYNKTVSVSLVDAGSGNGVCQNMAVLQSYGSIAFRKSDNGRKAFNFAYGNAVPNARIRIQEQKSGKIACSSDNFAIRPSHFLIQASDQDWVTPGTSKILNAVTASGTPIHKAGQPFTLRASAVNASGTATLAYLSGTPTATATMQGLPAGGALGTLATASWTFSTGMAQTTASYPEVGAVGIQVTDSGFAGVDASDGTPACQLTIGLRCDANGQPQYASAATTIGRFVPDHLKITVTATSIRNRTDAATLAGCNNNFSYLVKFSYLDEQFDLVFSIRARNAQKQITQNYTGALAKFDQPFAPDASASQGRWRFSAKDAASNTDLTARLAQNGFAGGTAFSNGEANGVVAQLKIGRLGSAPGFTPDGPFLDTDISLNPEDGDGVGLAGDPPFGSSAFYFGRLVADNAYGSELLPLPFWVRTQFWDSASRSWRDMPDDNCSLFQLSPQAGIALGAAAANDGRGYWTQADYSATDGQLFTPNGSGQHAGAQLWYTAGGSGGSFLVPFAAHAYLLSQPALAVFGRFQGNRHIIYWREVLN